MRIAKRIANLVANRVANYSTTVLSQRVWALSLAATCILPLSSALAVPQEAVAPQDMAVGYVGEGTRVSVGKANVGSLRGEISHAFAGDEKSAWIGETWFGKQVGGLKLSRHWLQGESEKDGGAVAKLFAAWDRNAFGDQKLTLGGGGENESLFWGGYGAFGLTGRRDAGQSTSSKVDTVFGSDPNLGDYSQQLTTTTTIRTFEQAYDYGVGARVGHRYQPLLVRLTAGLDHEWGQASSSQTTASLGIEKFFTNSPHSVLLNLASATKRGEFETDRHDHRVGLFWRYELDGKSGSSTRAAKRMGGGKAESSAPAVQSLSPGVSTPAAVQSLSPALVAPRVVAVEVLFDMDKADLRPQARKELDDLVAAIPTKGAGTRLTVTGHTCDVGREAYNRKLSERRAGTVRDYLVSAGLSAEWVQVDAKGELSPKYPNTRAERYKNRRCELDLVITPASTEVQTVAVVAAPVPGGSSTGAASAGNESARQPEWIRRAIYNPIRHKQEVDVYRTQERNVATTAGDRVYLNRAPLAVDDAVSWPNSGKPIDVLANDRDPDGDALRVIGVTPGAHGQTSIRADGQVDYVAQSGWEGGDQFTYTVSDGKNGGTASARVTIAARPNLPPVAVDDQVSWLGSKMPAIIDVLANDSDPDGDKIAVVSVTNGANGAVSIRPDGKLNYMMNSLWNGVRIIDPYWEGTDQFTYTISDGKGGTATAKVTILIVDP